MPVNEDKQVEVLHDHYKDTFQHMHDHWKVRNRLFGLILVVLTLMLFQLTSPNVLERLANNYIRNQTSGEQAGGAKGTSSHAAADGPTAATETAATLGTGAAANSEPVDFRFITSLLWFTLASLLVQYHQRTILVDRLYIYLARLEARLCELLSPSVLTREGKFYEEGMPKYLRHVGFLYRVVFLVLLLMIIVAKLFQEWRSAWAEGWNAPAIIFGIVNSVIAVTILYYSWLYLRWGRHKAPPKKKGDGKTDSHPAGGAAGRLENQS